MNTIQELPVDRSLSPERLEHIRIFAELATVGIGPSNLPFVPRKTFRAPVPQLRLVRAADA
jgi:hypothetical protein